MSKSFTRKTIKVSIALGKGVFSEGGNTRIIEGLACDVSVQKPGLPEQSSASVKIVGLKYEAMAQLTMLAFRPLESHRNTMTIEAGDEGRSLSMIFKGTISSASADFNNAPDPAMQFEASSGFFSQQIASPPTPVKGEAKATDLFAQWANEAGMTFTNQGVTTSVKNGYYSGDPIGKMTALAHDLGCEFILDDDEVITMPVGQARAGNAVLLNKETGMIGYPTFNQTGISLKCVFNPQVRYGSRVKVESIVPKASGVWRVTKLTHNLSAYTPGGGPWETQIEAAYPGGIL